MIDADHMNMCKFPNKSDKGYYIVSKDIESLVDEAMKRTQGQQGWFYWRQLL